MQKQIEIMAPKPFAVTVHPFTSPTPSACAYERGNTFSRNALIYIDGLTGGPHRAQHLDPIVGALQADSKLSYSFWEFRMRSSYTGFGFSSLANDAEDISALVTYLRELGKEKIVLLGSSTGRFSTLEASSTILTSGRMPGYSYLRRV